MCPSACRENPQKSGRVSNLDLGECHQISGWSWERWTSDHSQKKRHTKLLVTEPAPATTSTTTALINFFIVGYNKYAWVRIFCSTETTPNGRSYLQLFPVSENIGGITGGIREGSYSIIMLYIQFFYLHTTIIQCHKLFLGTVTTVVMLLFNLLASL